MTATTKFTYFIPQSVLNQVQPLLDDSLRKNGATFAIPDNQIPKSIEFNGSGRLDGNGKLVLTATKAASICGTGTLTIDPQFTATGSGATGSGATATGSYRIVFPDKLTFNVLGRQITSAGTCNDLPLRTGTLSMSR